MLDLVENPCDMTHILKKKEQRSLPLSFSKRRHTRPFSLVQSNHADSVQGSEKIVFKTVSFHTVYYENTPTQYTAIFHGCKKVNFQMKKNDIYFF